MDEFIAAITESARVLGIDFQSDVFLSAIMIGKEAIASGFEVDFAIELARRVLVDVASPFERTVTSAA